MVSLKNFLIFFLLLLCTISCEKKIETTPDCIKYKTKEYSLATVDTTLLRKAYEYQQYLLDKFKESSITELNHDAYHLQFYSSHGYGMSVKYEKKNIVYTLTVKCVGKKEWIEDCKDYSIDIEKEDWEELEKMIYEFDFWTAEYFRTNDMVLDGYAVLLEGNRPSAESCNLITNKLIARGSPRYDRMGDLCDNILDHEDQLRTRYEYMKRIK